MHESLTQFKPIPIFHLTLRPFFVKLKTGPV